MRRLFFVLAISLIALSLVVGNALAAEKEIKVGIPLSMTGLLAWYGDQMKKGAELAIDEVNSRGLAGSFKLKPFFADGKCLPVETSNAVEKLIKRDEVDFMIGEVCSSSTLAIAPIAKREKIPLIVPTAGADNVTTPDNPYVFRVVLDNTQNAQALGDAIIKNVKPKTMAIVYELTDYGVGISKILKNMLESAGISVVASEGVDANNMDFYALVAKLKQIKPEGTIVLLMINPAVAFSRTVKELGLQTQMFATQLLAPRYDELAGEAAWGLIRIFFYHPSTTEPVGVAFTKAYKDKFGAEPNHYNAEMYDAVYVAADALKRCCSQSGKFDREAMIKALRGVKNLPGVMGSTTFDEKGQTLPKRVLFVQNQQGKLTIMPFQR